MKREKKPSELSQNAIRQLKVLENYADVDYDARIVTLTLKADKLSELLDTSIEKNGRPCFSNVLLSQLSDKIHAIPSEFKIALKLKVNDYEGHDPKIVLSSIQDSFEIFAYNIRKEKNASALKISGIITFSIALFAWLFYLCTFKFFGDQDSFNHKLIHEITFAVGSALLWECANMVFIPSHSYKDISYSILDDIVKIELLDANDKSLASCSNDEMRKDWITESKETVLARKCLVSIGTAIMCIAFAYATEIITISRNITDGGVYIANLAITIASIIFMIISATGAISLYLGKGPFKKLVPIFGAITTITNLSNLISAISILVTQKGNNVFQVVVSSVLFLLTAALFICSVYLLKQSKKKEHNTLDKI